MAKFYAVHQGRETGVFTTWDECKPLVHKYTGASYKSFQTQDEAVVFWLTGEELKPNKCYGVAKGREPGVYASWAKVQKQLRNFSNPLFQKFDTIEEAKDYVAMIRNIDRSEVSVFQSHFDQFQPKAEETSDVEPTSDIKFESVDDNPIKDEHTPDAERSPATEYTTDTGHITDTKHTKDTEHTSDAGHTPDVKLESTDNRPFLDEFNAVASSQHWNSQEYRHERHNAIKGEFNFLFLGPLKVKDEDEEGLSTEEIGYRRKMKCYQALCRALGKDEPLSIPDARRKLKAKPWVNIIDLIDFQRMGKPFETWDNFEAFKQYTSKTGKFINLSLAKEHEFLSALLVDFENGLDDQRKRFTPHDFDSGAQSDHIQKRQ